MSAPSVFIDGEAGTTGLEIRERLLALPGVVVRSIDPALRKDARARQDLMAQVDVVVLCLPDDAAREAVALAAALGDKAPRILDASTAHRTDPAWVYGFPEMAPGQAQAIAQARYVSNPGCYPTGAVALLRPLRDAGLLSADAAISINAVSGYSGGGRTMIEAHEQQGGPAFELYALGLAHKHVPEIMAGSRLERRPIFVPSVGHFRQGMLVSVPLHLDSLTRSVSGADLFALLQATYQGCDQVKVVPAEGGTLLADTLAGSDLLELRVYAHEAHRQAVLVARLDNLGKGASGAAVRNIALMLGLVPHDR